MKNVFAVLITFCVLLTTATGCSSYSRGPWSGRVIDSETKQPIEGAAVVMVWQTQQEGGFAAVFHYLDSEETLTDKDGKFEIGAKSFTQTRGLSKVYGPKMVIYKPGYGSYPGYQVIPKPWTTHENYFEKEGAVVELPKFKSKKDRTNALNEMESLLSLPDKHLRPPLTSKIIDEENKFLGY